MKTWKELALWLSTKCCACDRTCQMERLLEVEAPAIVHRMEVEALGKCFTGPLGCKPQLRVGLAVTTLNDGLGELIDQVESYRCDPLALIRKHQQPSGPKDESLSTRLASIGCISCTGVCLTAKENGTFTISAIEGRVEPSPDKRTTQELARDIRNEWCKGFWPERTVAELQRRAEAAEEKP